MRGSALDVVSVPATTRPLDKWATSKSCHFKNRWHVRYLCDYFLFAYLVFLRCHCISLHFSVIISDLQPEKFEWQLRT